MRDRLNHWIYAAQLGLLQVFMWVLLILTVGVFIAWAVSAIV